MTIDLSSIARRIQPAAVLVSVSKLLKRLEQPEPPRRPGRRSMNG
jgi:hypothetical protein